MGCNTVFDYPVKLTTSQKHLLYSLAVKNLFLLENLLIKFQPFSNYFLLVLGRVRKPLRTTFQVDQCKNGLYSFETLSFAVLHATEKLSLREAGSPQ